LKTKNKWMTVLQILKSKYKRFYCVEDLSILKDYQNKEN